MSATTNRLTDPGYGYDANGNMTNDGLNALGYNAENRLVSSASATYTYDGAGLRVKKVSGGTTTVYIFSGAKVIAEYLNGAAPASPTREYIYSGSGLLATIEGGTTKYNHSDHLSPRVTTDSSGALIGQQGHYPFGESWYSLSTTTKWQFTTYERDAESGNDYAMMRYHVNRLGRFNSPDLIAGSVRNPQSQNLFSYVQNDPINWFDPLGLTMCQSAPCDNGGGGGGCMVASCGSSGLEFAVYYLNGVEVSAEQAARFLGSGQAVVCSDCRGGGTTGPQTQISITWNEWGDVISRLCMDANLTACYPPDVAHYIQLTIIETTILEESTASWFSDFGSAGQTSTDARSPSTLDARANALAGAINKTGVQAIANPCAVAGFYLLSAVPGLAAKAGAVVAVANETLAPYAPQLTRVLYLRASQGVGVLTALKNIPFVKHITDSVNQTVAGVCHQ